MTPVRWDPGVLVLAYFHCNRFFTWYLFLVAFLYCHVAFWTFCECGGICHRTESDLFIFLLVFILFYIPLFYILNTLTYLLPEMWDIVQIMQFLQIDLPKFCFTDLGPKSANLIKTTCITLTSAKTRYSCIL